MPVMPRLLILLCVLALNISARGGQRTQLPKLPPNPSFVSLVFFEGGETLTSQFGHIDLRFSYGSTPGRPEDRTVGFGPSEEDKQTRGPLAYIGVGDDLKMEITNESFADRYQDYSRQRMQRLVTLVLDLTAEERNELVESFNAVIATGYPKPYNIFFENCATIVAKFLSDLSPLPRGLMSFVPAKLEKKLRPFAIQREVLASGRDLKRAVLDRHAKLLEGAFEDAVGRSIFEQQLMSRQTEFRVLGYRKLLTIPGGAALLEALLDETESRARAQSIRRFLGRATQFVSVQRSFSLASDEKFRSIRIENGVVTLVADKKVSGLPASRGVSRAETRVRRERRWSFAQLGLRPDARVELDSLVARSGSRSEVYFWLATDLALDRK